LDYPIAGSTFFLSFRQVAAEFSQDTNGSILVIKKVYLNEITYYIYILDNYPGPGTYEARSEFGLYDRPLS